MIDLYCGVKVTEILNYKKDTIKEWEISKIVGDSINLIDSNGNKGLCFRSEIYATKEEALKSIGVKLFITHPKPKTEKKEMFYTTLDDDGICNPRMAATTIFRDLSQAIDFAKEYLTKHNFSDIFVNDEYGKILKRYKRVTKVEVKEVRI